jgi:hypothetical protein
VTGTGLSELDGQLIATGGVWLINPNGVIVGKTGVVSTGGSFVASTLDVSDSAFLAGGALTLSGSSQAQVVNYGAVGSTGGDVVLVAAKVQNAGTISAAQGSAGLLAGYQVTLLDQAVADGKFQVLVGGAGTSATNSGAMRAAEIELKANGGNVYALAGTPNRVIAAPGTASRRRPRA